MSASEEELEKRLQKKKEAHAIREFKKQQKMVIMTSRFTNATQQENEKFREKSWKTGCIYCSPEQVSEKISVHSTLLVLEMNNDTNKIIGVGMCANKPFINRYAIYSNENYNRYNYVGKYRITREELTQEEEAVFKALDILCFRGNEHMKRGHGIKAFPTKICINCMPVINLVKYIELMFTKRYAKDRDTSNK